MQPTDFSTSKPTNRTRKQILERKKSISELIKAASIQKDPLAPFPSFRQFHQNDLFVYLESGSGDKLSALLKQDLQALLKDNMESHFGHEWPTEEKVKRREMVNPEARYIFVYEDLNKGTNSSKNEEENVVLDDKSDLPFVGFVHYRFTLEEELPVVYVYEIQLQSRVQGKGLGKFLMQLIELIARKSCMSAVVLTVQKANVVAMDFYTSKLRYSISRISPSKFDALMGINTSYEILCKAFDSEAKNILEV